MEADSKLGVKFNYDDFDLIYDMVGSLKENYRYKSFRLNYTIYKIITKLLEKWGYIELTHKYLTLDETVLAWCSEFTSIDDYSRYHNITIDIYTKGKVKEFDKPTFRFFLSYDGIIKFFYMGDIRYEYTRQSLDVIFNVISKRLVPIKKRMNSLSSSDLDNFSEDITKEIQELIKSEENIREDFDKLKQYDDFLKRLKNQYDTLYHLRSIIHS